jgi:hypothetical protein
MKEAANKIGGTEKLYASLLLLWLNCSTAR